MASCDLEEWAGRIYETLPSGVATSGSVLTWLRSNTFRLNAYFDTEYYLSGQCIEPTLTNNHSGVYEESYRCNLLQKLALNVMGATLEDLVETSMEGQGRVRFVSRNERARTLRLDATECEARLRQLIDDLNSNGDSVTVSQILYSDRNHMINGDHYCPDSHLYSPDNTVFNKYYIYRD